MVAALGALAPAARASLGVPTGGSATPYASISAFDQDAGGGSRHIDWDSLAVNGSDPGSTAIFGGHTAAVARNALEPFGFEIASDIAVADDGFHSVNPSAHFTPFSRPNVWGPFNSPTGTAEFDIVAPAAPGTTPIPAQTRGLGIVFLNATVSTQIQYYNGDIQLGSASPTPGGTSFAGLLFPDPVVTRVVVTLGGGQIFSYNGSGTPMAGGANPVAGDDIVLSNPAPARPTVAATAGVPVGAVLDTFTEDNPNATPHATIDWGDGTTTPGTITPAGGGTFVVTGGHAYAAPGSYWAHVVVDDASGPEQTKQTDIIVGSRATATSINCSPTSVAVSASALCTATVADVTGGSPSAPTGLVSFTSPTAGVSFAQDGGCLLGPTARPGVSTCSVRFTPGQLPPAQARLLGAYAGDGAHVASSAETIIAVRPQRCTLRALSRRLRAGGLGVLVTCDARSGVQIAVRALVARKGRRSAAQLSFGSVQGPVTAGRPTVLVIKPARGVLPTLRDALRRHQRVSLKLTLTASSSATRRTTTVSLPALRLR